MFVQSNKALVAHLFVLMLNFFLYYILLNAMLEVTRETRLYRDIQEIFRTPILLREQDGTVGLNTT